MWRELDVSGVFLPPILAYLAAALLLHVSLRFVLGRAGAWRLVWNPALVSAALYVCILALLLVWL